MALEFIGECRESRKRFYFSIYDAASVYVGAYAFFVCAIVLFAFVMICAEVTYKVIEVPGIRLGSRIIKQISSSKSAT